MISGNMIGSYSQIGKTFVFVDEDGNEVAGVVTDNPVIFTATDDDVREGVIYASSDGVSTGTKVIPSYHTTDGFKVVTNGSKFSITLDNLDKYNYTKLQAIICDFNTNASNSTAANKVAINDNVYNVNLTNVVSAISKDDNAKAIDFGITNNSGKTQILRFFTYKEIE